MLPFLFSFCCVFSGFLNVNVFASDNIFSSYKTWVEDGATSSAQWIEGTSSTNGNMYIDLNIDVSAESVRIYSNQGTIGYNAGLFVSRYPVVAGDKISFNLSSSVKSDLIAFGIKTDYSPNGIYSFTYNYNYDSANVVEYGLYRQYQGNENVSFTASNDGYFYIFGFVGAEYQVDFTISDLYVDGVLVKNEIVQAIEDQYKMEDGEDFGINDVISQHNDKMGVLSFGSDVMIQFLDMFQNTNPGTAQLTLPGFAITVQNVEYQVWQDQTFNFNQLETWFPSLIDIIRLILPAFVWLMVLRYCIGVFERNFLSK